MKEALVSPGTKVQIVDSPVPEPEDDYVLIKVVVSGSNPKDWKYPNWRNLTLNQGDDIAGIVHKVGVNVTEFKPGDRVAAFHEMGTPHGSYAEYALAPQHTTFHLPPRTTFEEGAAIPLAAFTPLVGLYEVFGLPQPWIPAKEDIPLIIYGASSAVGSYTIQFAQRANIHPLICIAGKSQAHVEALIDKSKGDVVIDYRNGEDAVVAEVKKVAGDRKLLYAYDAISEQGSTKTLGKILASGGKIVTVLPVDDSEVPSHVTKYQTAVSAVHKEFKDLGYVFAKYISKGLQEGWFKPQPQVVVPGGLGGVEKGLQDLQAGKANAIKYVFRIADTEGVSQ